MQSQAGVSVDSSCHRPPSEQTVNIAIAEAVAGYRHVFGERLAQVWLFGSRALGTHRPDSDVDLLAVLHEEGPIGSELDLLYSIAEPIRCRTVCKSTVIRPPWRTSKKRRRLSLLRQARGETSGCVNRTSLFTRTVAFTAWDERRDFSNWTSIRRASKIAISPRSTQPKRP